MRIYTRTGDDGSTGLFGGARIGKDDLRIEAYGTLDELNAWLGKVATHEAAAPLRPQLQAIQSEIFTLGSHLATTDPQWKSKLPSLAAHGPEGLESWMDELDSRLPELTSFVLPGGHPAAADAHVARTVCRRAERRCVELHRIEPMDSLGLAYLNRLSDALFILGRWLAYSTGSEELPWNPSKD
jgi:cob(I)alamin adenosyltransferase